VIKSPQILITFLGANPIVPTTTIKTFANPSSEIYLFHTNNNSKIANVKQWSKRYNYQINYTEIEAFNIEKIIKMLNNNFNTNFFKNKIIHIDITGGTKEMITSILNYFSINIINTKNITILYNRSEEFNCTNASTLKTTIMPIKSKFSLKEIRMLHIDSYTKKSPFNQNLQSLSKAIVTENINQNGFQKWQNWKKDYIRNQCTKNGHSLKSNTQLGPLKFKFDMFVNINKLNFLQNQYYQINELTQILSLKDNQETVDWFNGFWLETYVQSIIKNTNIDNKSFEYEFNITTKKPQFEIDSIVKIDNQTFVLSISTERSKRGLKLKIFEVMTRAVQLLGWKAKFGLICLSEDPEVLEEEVKNVRFNDDLKVFGKSHLENLNEHLHNWLINQ